MHFVESSADFPSDRRFEPSSATRVAVNQHFYSVRRCSVPLAASKSAYTSTTLIQNSLAHHRAQAKALPLVTALPIATLLHRSKAVQLYPLSELALQPVLNRVTAVQYEFTLLTCWEPPAHTCSYQSLFAVFWPLQHVEFVYDQLPKSVFLMPTSSLDGSSPTPFLDYRQQCVISRWFAFAHALSLALFPSTYSVPRSFYFACPNSFTVFDFPVLDAILLALTC